MFFESFKIMLWISLWYLIIGVGCTIVIGIPLVYFGRKWYDKEEEKDRIRKEKRDNNFMRKDYDGR